MYSFTVSFEESFLRVDSYLCTKLVGEGISRERIKKAILMGQCFVNNVLCITPKYKVREGDAITFAFIDEYTYLDPDDSPLEIVYQDKYLVVVNKPPGLVVHPSPSCKEKTLVHRLISKFPEIKMQGGVRPGIVHRLDKDTSGLICVALTEEVRVMLSEAFMRREVIKTYLALVEGISADSGVIQAPIGRDPDVKVRMKVVKGGKTASTEWKVLYRSKTRKYSLLQVEIHTGRTHQIRVHLQHVGTPILGDSLYKMVQHKGEMGNCYEGHVPKRQMLHAWKLGFNHPVTKSPLFFLEPPPDDFLHCARALEVKMQRIVITGGAATGKSTVLEIFRSFGLPVWSADKVVEALYAPGGELWTIFKDRYGDLFIPSDDAPVDKKKLIEALLGELTVSIDIRDVEAIVHPIVFAHLESFWEAAQNDGYEYAVAEVPLWFESERMSGQMGMGMGHRGTVDFVIGVFCLNLDQLTLFREKRGWNKAFQLMVETQQLPQDVKLNRCDYVINNEKNKGALEDECRRIFSLIKESVDKGKDDFGIKLKNLTTR